MSLLLEHMQADDVPVVALIEQKQHLTPWRASGFEDALLHGWHTGVLRSKDMSAESGTNLPSAVVGYFVAMTSGDDEELLTLTVCPKAEHRGYGRQLLAALIDGARERGAQKLFLEVRQSNTRAIHLYKSAGFTIVGMRKNYYVIPADTISGRPPGREDALLMQLVLQASVR